MSKRSGGNTRTKGLRSLLSRHLGRGTVLGVAIPVLADHIECAKTGRTSDGLTEKQIESSFREILSPVIKHDYHSTYIQRRLGGRGFLELRKGRYRLRQSLLAGLSTRDLEGLLKELLESLRLAYEQPR